MGKPKDNNEDTLGGPSFELDPGVAIDYCKGKLIEELRNDPNRGHSKILEIE